EKEKQVYFELYNYKAAKGRIQSIDLEGENWGDSSTILQNDTHFSYPFNFCENDNKTFICPENYQSGKVQLYEIRDKRLIPGKIIINGQWVDPTLHFHNDYWWLFVSSKENSNEDLHIFYSDKLEGQLKAHPL